MIIKMNNEINIEASIGDEWDEFEKTIENFKKGGYVVIKEGGLGDDYHMQMKTPEVILFETKQ